MAPEKTDGLPESRAARATKILARTACIAVVGALLFQSLSALTFDQRVDERVSATFDQRVDERVSATFDDQADNWQMRRAREYAESAIWRANELLSHEFKTKVDKSELERGVFSLQFFLDVGRSSMTPRFIEAEALKLHDAVNRATNEVFATDDARRAARDAGE